MDIDAPSKEEIVKSIDRLACILPKLIARLDSVPVTMAKHIIMLEQMAGDFVERRGRKVSFGIEESSLDKILGGKLPTPSIGGREDAELERAIAESLKTYSAEHSSSPPVVDYDCAGSADSAVERRPSSATTFVGGDEWKKIFDEEASLTEGAASVSPSKRCGASSQQEPDEGAASVSPSKRCGASSQQEPDEDFKWKAVRMFYRSVGKTFVMRYPIANRPEDIEETDEEVEPLVLPPLWICIVSERFYGLAMSRIIENGPAPDWDDAQEIIDEYFRDFDLAA